MVLRFMREAPDYKQKLQWRLPYMRDDEVEHEYYGRYGDQDDIAAYKAQKDAETLAATQELIALLSILGESR